MSWRILFHIQIWLFRAQCENGEECPEVAWGRAYLLETELISAVSIVMCLIRPRQSSAVAKRGKRLIFFSMPPGTIIIVLRFALPRKGLNGKFSKQTMQAKQHYHCHILLDELRDKATIRPHQLGWKSWIDNHISFRKSFWNLKSKISLSKSQHTDVAWWWHPGFCFLFGKWQIPEISLPGSRVRIIKC